MSKELRGTLFAIIAGVSWGFSGCCGQYLFTYYPIDSKWLTCIRMLFSGIILIAMSLIRDRVQFKETLHDKKDMCRIFMFGVFGLMLCQYSYLTGIQYTNAPTATVIQYIGPVFVVIAVCIIEHRRPKTSEITALILAIGGTFLICTHGKLGAIVISPRGLFWCLAAAVTLAWYNLILGDTAKKRPVIVCNGFGMMIGGVVLSAVLRLWTYNIKLDLKALIYVSSIVIIGTVIGFTFYLQGVKDLGAAKASILACIEPVSSAVISFFWLGTEFQFCDIIGFTCILATVFILRKE